MYYNFIKYFGLFRNELLPYGDVNIIMKISYSGKSKIHKIQLKAFVLPVFLMCHNLGKWK